MELSKARVVIVGAGQAGARAAEALRAAGHCGPITMIGEEEHLPYERPQLSKAILTDLQASPAFIRTSEAWSDLDISLCTSSRAVAADIGRRRIGLADGREVAFDRLLLATGTRPRRLPVLENTALPVGYLRCMNDALALRQALEPGRNVVLVGGGVIGLEVASAAVTRGCNVTVLEKASTLLPQIGSPALSRYAQRLHTSKGVRIIHSAAINRANSGGLELDDGRLVAADMALVGVGVEPTAELAHELGLQVDQGIKVTPNGATALDGIFAAGDVAEQWSRCHDRWMRVENWANAQNQAIAIAKNMAGTETPYDAPPWFWSDQYGVNCQGRRNQWPLHDDQPARRRSGRRRRRQFRTRHGRPAPPRFIAQAGSESRS